MQQKQCAFTVKLDIPINATVEDAIEYINAAVVTWREQLFHGDHEYEGDPMAELDIDSVHVELAESGS